MKDDRFQNQNGFVKLWRLRHYLTIPFVAMSIYYHEHTRELRDADDWRMSFKNSWGLATGLAQGKMKWYYHRAEFNDDFDLKNKNGSSMTAEYRVDVYSDNELESLIYSGPAIDEPISSTMCKLLEPEVLATLVKNIKFYPSDEILANSIKGAKVYENGVLYATVAGWQPHWHAEAKIGPQSSFGFFVGRENLA